MRSHVQRARLHQPQFAALHGAQRFARADRRLEPHLEILREEPQSQQGKVSTDMKTIRFALAAILFVAATATAQDDPPAGRGGRGGARGAWQGPMDTVRARQLYVSRNPADLQGCANRGSDPCGDREKKKVDSTWAANAAKFKYTYEKVTWKSDVDGLEIPAAI